MYRAILAKHLSNLACLTDRESNLFSFLFQALPAERGVQFLGLSLSTPSGTLREALTGEVEGLAALHPGNLLLWRGCASVTSDPMLAKEAALEKGVSLVFKVRSSCSRDVAAYSPSPDLQERLHSRSPMWARLAPLALWHGRKHVQGRQPVSFSMKRTSLRQLPWQPRSESVEHGALKQSAQPRCSQCSAALPHNWTIELSCAPVLQTGTDNTFVTGFSFDTGVLRKRHIAEYTTTTAALGNCFCTFSSFGDKEAQQSGQSSPGQEAKAPP
eukprot:g22758.t1